MNRYLTTGLKIVVFIALIIIVDRIAGYSLKWLYFHQKTGNNQSLTYTFRDCKEDIVIFGASQAQHNFDPRIIGNELKMSCYNGGQDGGHSILLHNEQVKILLTRYRPKIIIIELGALDALNYNTGAYDRLAILEPYYADFPQLRSTVLLRGPFEKLKLQSSVYPYNSKIISLIRLNTNFDKSRQWMYLGYIPINNKVLNTTQIKLDNNKILSDSIDLNKVAALKSIISECKAKGVKLFFTISPYYQSAKIFALKKESAKQLFQIIRWENIPLIDFNENSFFHNNPVFFADQKHLNENGANKFSLLISDILKVK